MKRTRDDDADADADADAERVVLPECNAVDRQVEGGIEAYVDDIVFKSCMLPSSSYDVARLSVPACSGAKAVAGAAAVPFSAPEVYYAYTNSDRLPNEPPDQPGAGIYTSPLTLNTERPLEEVKKVVEGVLKACQMPYEYEEDRYKACET